MLGIRQTIFGKQGLILPHGSTRIFGSSSRKTNGIIEKNHPALEIPWKSRGMSGIQHANEAIDSISPHWGHGDLENPQDPKSLGKETRTSHEILVSHRCFLLTMVD